MDEIFGGMNERLKVSIADSTMIWIVHSAMYKAHEKSKSKQGIITRLNEISKFYELAVLQLEGCLKFVQEEAESGDLDSDQQQVVVDLSEIQKRLKGRLEETETAMLEKDKELKERMKNEFKLKQSLEKKEAELARLHAKLEIERTKSEEMEMIICNRISDADKEDSDEGLDLLKNSVDQQVCNIKQKLELDHEHIYERIGSIDNKKVEEMSLEIDILKETMDLAFGKMHNAISSFEVGPTGQQWRLNIEKDIICIFVRDFISDLKEKFNDAMEKQQGRHSAESSEHWSELMEDMTSLCRELELLDHHSETMFESNTEGKVNKQERSKSLPIDSMSNYVDSFKVKEVDDHSMKQREEDGDHLVAKMIKNHESIIRKKREELNNWLHFDNFQGKESRTRSRSQEPESSTGRLREAIRKLDNTIKLNAKLGKTYGDGESDTRGESFRGRREREYNKQNQEFVVAGSNVACQKCVHASEGLGSNHGTRILNLEKEELDFQCMIVDEVLNILLKGLIREFNCELLDHESENLVWDNICKFFIDDLDKDCSNKVECMEIEACLREMVYDTIFSETMKNLKCTYDLKLGAGNKEVELKCVDRLSCNLEGSLRDNVAADMHTQIESYNIESLVREEMDRVIFDETFKSIIASAISELYRYQVFEASKCSQQDVTVSNELHRGLESLVEEVESLVREEIERMVIDETFKSIIASATSEFSRYHKVVAPKCSQQNIPVSNGLHRDQESPVKDFENLVKEETDRVVFDETFKSIIASATSELCRYQEVVAPKCSQQDIPVSNLLHRGLGSLVQAVCMGFFREMENRRKMGTDTHSLANLSKDEMQHFITAEAVKRVSNILDEQTNFNKVSIDDGKNIGSLDSKLVGEQQQATMSQSGPSLDITAGDIKKNYGQVTSFSWGERERYHYCQARDTEQELLKFSDSANLHLTGFSQVICDFESTVNEKLEMLILRLEEVEGKLHPLCQAVASLRQKESLYRKAFIKRSQNLQKAEIEVDLLGDQVEVLQDLLENLYKTLYQHLPILEHHFEVSSMMKLIHKELYGS